MNKTTTFDAISIIFCMSGVLFLTMVENHFGFGICAILCFIGMDSYHSKAQQQQTILSNQWYEGTGND